MPSEKQIEKMYEHFAEKRNNAAHEYARNVDFSPITDAMAKRAVDDANAKQIAGQHYKKQKIQTWDFVAQNDLDYFQGSIIKYVARWKDKGGIDDLKKAIHFLEKYIEVESGRSTGGT